MGIFMIKSNCLAFGLVHASLLNLVTMPSMQSNHEIKSTRPRLSYANMHVHLPVLVLYICSGPSWLCSTYRRRRWRRYRAVFVLVTQPGGKHAPPPERSEKVCRPRPGDPRLSLRLPVGCLMRWWSGARLRGGVLFFKKIF